MPPKRNLHSIPHTEGVYLLKWDIDPTPVYKIGRSINLGQRIKTYRLNRILDYFETDRCIPLEKVLIEEFNKAYKLIEGNEYFETDVDEEKVIDLFRKCIGHPSHSLENQTMEIKEHEVVLDFWISVYKFRDIVKDLKIRLERDPEEMSGKVDEETALDFWRLAGRALETLDLETVSMCETGLQTIARGFNTIIDKLNLNVIEEIYIHVLCTLDKITEAKRGVIMSPQRLESWKDLEATWRDANSLLEARRQLNQRLKAQIVKINIWCKMLRGVLPTETSIES
jgi:hypothetical protein